MGTGKISILDRNTAKPKEPLKPQETFNSNC